MSKKPAGPGGPRTPAGRKVVSNNAVTHGLTAARPATAAEAVQVDSLRSDLLAQYDPLNPLEKLQIDRIARSAAKLQRLHEIEAAAFQLAQENAFPPVADIVADVGPADAAVQADAVHILQGGSPSATLGLDDAVLAQLCDEIRAHGHKVATLADMQAVLPLTYAHVAQCGAQMRTQDLAQQLQALAAWLRPLPPAPERAGKYFTDGELSAVLEEEARARGVAWVRVRAQDDPATQAQGLQDDLNQLLHLQQHRQQVKELVERYPARIALLRQAAMPPGDEADRLMRYQVALDRQLSRGLGELLQMLAMRQRGELPPALPAPDA